MAKAKKSRKRSPRRPSVSPRVARQNLPLKRLTGVIQKIHPAVVILGLLVLVYFSLTLSCLYQRYIYLEMKEPTDSVAFMQITSSIFHGTPFTISIDENVPYESGLIDHPSNTLGSQLYFTLVLLSPIFLLTSSTVPFLVIQALIVSLAAIPLYLLAERLLKDKWLALLITTLYLFNPATYESFEKFGFRLENLFFLAFFTMFYLLEKDNYWGAGISLLFALFTKHNMIMFSFMLGLYYLIFDRKQWRFGIFCLAVAGAYYIVGVRMIIYKYQAYEQASFRLLSAFGNSPQEVLINMALHPEKIWSAISPLEWQYTYRIFFPAGFLALLHPVFWVCLPQLVMNATLRDYHSIYCAWHWAAVVPFLFVGMVYSISWILAKFHQHSYLKYILYAILAVTLFYNFADYNKTVLAADKDYYYKQNNIDTTKIIDQLSIIEPQASVMASGQLIWFFAAREHLYIARQRFHDEVDYVAVLLPMGQRGYLNLDRNFMKEIPNPNSKYLKNFRVVSKSPHLIILKNISYP